MSIKKIKVSNINIITQSYSTATIRYRSWQIINRYKRYVTGQYVKIDIIVYPGLPICKRGLWCKCNLIIGSGNKIPECAGIKFCGSACQPLAYISGKLRQFKYLVADLLRYDISAVAIEHHHALIRQIYQHPVKLLNTPRVKPSVMSVYPHGLPFCYIALCCIAVDIPGLADINIALIGYRASDIFAIISAYIVEVEAILRCEVFWRIRLRPI